MAVIDGSHEGPLYDHYDAAGRWAGCLSAADVATLDLARARYLTAQAGALTIHNCRTIHGSPPSESDEGRPLLLNAYAAADATPYAELDPPAQSVHCGEIVRGERAAEPMSIRGPAPCRPTGAATTPRSTPTRAARAPWCGPATDDLSQPAIRPRRWPCRRPCLTPLLPLATVDERGVGQYRTTVAGADMASGCVHIGGEFVELDDAKMSIFDTGFLHSDVVYDVTTSWQGYIFKLDEHLERFTASCSGFRLTNPYSKDETARLLAECVRRAASG